MMRIRTWWLRCRRERWARDTGLIVPTRAYRKALNHKALF